MTPPAFADADHPTATQLRRRALWSNWRGIADLAPGEQAGTAFGWYNLIAGVMLLPASLLFGWLWEGVSPLAAFAFGSVCALLAAALLAWWVPRAVCNRIAHSDG